MKCPTKGISDLAGYSVINYSLSPSGDYLIFIYDQSCPLCDFRRQPFESLIKIDGTGYLSLWTKDGYRTHEKNTENGYNDELIDQLVLWRPIVP